MKILPKIKKLTILVLRLQVLFSLFIVLISTVFAYLFKLYLHFNWLSTFIIWGGFLIFFYLIYLMIISKVSLIKNNEHLKLATTKKQVQSLIQKYAGEPLIYYHLKPDYLFPGILSYQRKNPDNEIQLRIIDEQLDYQIPQKIQPYLDELMASHKQAYINDNLTIRLKDFQINNQQITLFTERTTYFHSLMTNRACDKKLSNQQTVRDMLEPSGQMTSLGQSLFSNHIGINVFIETSDQKFVFILRGKKVSIGANKLGIAVAASLKAKYALNEEKKFTLEGFQNGIVKEIADELQLEVPHFNIEQNFIAMYRDLIEAGKPQFIFYYKTNLTFAQLQQQFTPPKEAIQTNVVDGITLVGIDKSNLVQDSFFKDYSVIDDLGQHYTFSPSHATALVILLNHLHNKTSTHS